MLLTRSRGRAERAQDVRTVEGRIRIAAPADTSLQFLCGWLGEYKLLYPRIQITVMVGDRLLPPNPPFSRRHTSSPPPGSHG